MLHVALDKTRRDRRIKITQQLFADSTERTAQSRHKIVSSVKLQEHETASKMPSCCPLLCARFTSMVWTELFSRQVAKIQLVCHQTVLCGPRFPGRFHGKATGEQTFDLAIEF